MTNKKLKRQDSECDIKKKPGRKPNKDKVTFPIKDIL